jgi:arylsulfatase A-like enzyme
LNKTDRYDDKVRQADGIIRQIFDALRAKHYLDNAIVVVTGDHGEGWESVTGRTGGITASRRHPDTDAAATNPPPACPISRLRRTWTSRRRFSTASDCRFRPRSKAAVAAQADAHAPCHQT